MRPVLLGIALIVPPVALAGGTLEGDHVAVGVNDDGSLCDGATDVCIFYDPEGMGQGAPLGNDLLIPGRAFETWSMAWRTGDQPHAYAAGAPDLRTGRSMDWSAPAQGEDLLYLIGTLELDGVQVELAVDVPRGDEVFWTTFTLTATEDVSDLSVARTVDVDPDAYANGGDSTINEADGSVAVAASRLSGGKALALAITGGEAGLCNWCASPQAVRDGIEGIRDGDYQIGVASPTVDLAAGESITLRFAFGLGMGDDQARERAAAAMAVDDLDGDGQTIDQGDCDDRDADTGPGAPERADGVDNDCDGAIDEDTIVSDDDGDGFSEVDGDCDDALATVHPGADPVADVLDADCDGLADSDPFADGSRPAGWGAEEVKSGCSAVPASPSLLLLLLPALALWRRR